MKAKTQKISYFLIISLLITSLFSCFVINNTSKANSSTVSLKLKIGSPNLELLGNTIAIDDNPEVKPIIYSNRTLLPIRAVIEQLGGNVEWDETNKYAKLIANGNTIEYSTLNSEPQEISITDSPGSFSQIQSYVCKNELKVNGESKQNDVPPIIINDRTYVPLRFIIENISYKVSWNENTYEVTITKTIANKIDPDSGYKIVGYFPGWRNSVIDTVKFDKLTHVIVAFAYVKDSQIYINSDSTKMVLEKLIAKKKEYPHLRTLVSIAGLDDDNKNNLREAIKSEQNLSKLTSSIYEFLKKYNLDGIDIDWEHPSETDKENISALVKSLRTKLDDAGKNTNKHYYLTFAAGAGKSFIKLSEIDKLHPMLDWINLMTYHFDFNKHNANLYPSEFKNSKEYSCNTSVKNLIEAGIPANKILLGIPFYGLKGTTAISYKDLCEKYIEKDGFKREWDDQGKVPYLIKEGSFISYDDTESIFHKSSYIKSNKLGGAMIWEISLDYKSSLLEKIFETLR